MDRVTRFRALVDQDPANPLFRFSLAQALDSASDAEAEAHYRFCVDTRTDWMMPRILLGKWLLAAGRPGEARPFLESALALAIDQDHEDPARELQHLLADLA